MTPLYGRLSLKHIVKGWPIYWRLCLPFWIHLVYITAMAAFVLFSENDRMLIWAIRFCPKIEQWPILLNFLFAIIVYAAFFPLVRKLVRAVSDKFQIDFCRSQFAVFDSLIQCNRAIQSLYAAFLLMVVIQWDWFTDMLPYYGLWLMMLVIFLIAVGTTGISISLYGWLADQFSETGGAGG